MNIPRENNISNKRARILSVFVVFVMVASALVAIVPDANEGADNIVPEPAAPATYVVISEVVNECAGTEDHEFVELYNPTGADISLVGWDILYESTTFSGWDLEYTIEATDGNSGIIKSNGFYLIGEEGGGGNDVFDVFGLHVDNLGNPGINLGWGQNSHVAIRDETDTLIDKVGMGTATSPETATTPQPAAGSSAERKSGTTHVEDEGNGWDTDNNLNDFITRVGPQPQNSDSATEGGGADTDPPELDYAISTSTTEIEVHFNEPVNQADVETLSNWKIISLSGFDTTAPYIVECKATSLTSVEVTFSEAVNSADANNIANYEMVTGLPITNAVLDAELTTVNLTTNPQTADFTYTLLVSWINDTANPPNVIDIYSEASFNGGGGSGNMKIIFIDAEQGDCTLIISPTGDAMLFDGGDTGTGDVILNTLTTEGVTHLNYIVASHYHEDHIGAFDEVIDIFGLGNIDVAFDRGGSYSSSPYDEYENAVFPIRMPLDKDDILELGGGVTSTCIAVNGNGLNPTDENDKGIVLRVDYQNFQMYLGGDLSGYNTGDYTDIESSVANDIGKVEVYQVDHHGSEHSSNPVLLAAMDPLASVFSVGNNGYGHVDGDAYDRILNQGSYMYYTNAGSGVLPSGGEGEIVGGNIELNTDGNSFDIEGDMYQCHDQIDTTPPTIIDVRATHVNHVELTFSESINFADAEDENNYDIDGGLGTPGLAELQPDLRTVNLTTAGQTEGQTYTITINDIRDRASTPNTILTDTMVSFTGGRPTLGITGATIDAGDHSIVYLTTDVQSRIGYSLEATDIRDEAPTPNLQPETTVSFVGGGYHLTINEIYYDDSAADDDKEWWEIHNPETNNVNIKSWKFSDDGSVFGLPSDELLVPQNGYSTMAMNGQEFYRMYGYYPDFEVFGSTESKDMSYSGSVHSTLGNTADHLEMTNRWGEVYDAVAWGTEDYGNITGFTAPDVSSGSSLERVTPGREGPEDVLLGEPTGADEKSEKQSLGVFQSATPNPQTLDSQPPQIEDIHWDIGSVFAVIYWNTTEPGWPEINPEADTKVVYSINPDVDAGPNTTAYVSIKAIEHGIMLYPLDANQDYYFYVESTDGIGQTAVDKNGGSFYHFKTTVTDATAPIISNVQATVTDTTAHITWETDEISSSLVSYDESAPLMFMESNLHLTVDHSIMLSGLSPSTSYDFSVSSKNPSGLQTVDDDGGSFYSFTTNAVVTMNYYLGNMDSFTEYSSGIDTPAEAYDYANGGAGALEPGADHIVISEVVNDCAGTEDHEFVELYNPTAGDISLVGWDILYESSTFSGWDLEYTILASDGNSGIIKSNGFYLIGEEGGGANDVFNVFGVHVDNFDNPGINLGWGTNCHVGIRDGSDTLIDHVGLESATNPETTSTPQPGAGESAERKSGDIHVEGNGNGMDTDNNMNDFTTRVGPEPQNSGSAVEIPTAGTGPDIDVLGINDYSYILDAGEYTDGKAQQAIKTTDDDFIALYGQQLWDGSEGYGQISVYDESTEEIATGNALVNLDDAYQWVIDHDAIGIFNAPGYRGTFDDMAYDPAADVYMNALEILDGYMYSDYEYYYNMALREGWHVGALAGQRNEYGNWGNLVNAYGKIDMTMFKAPDLTTTSIENALKTMSFYAYEADTPAPTADPVVEDPIYLNYSINGHDMGQEFTDSNDLVFNIGLNAMNPFYEVEILEDGVVIATWDDIPTNDLDWQYIHSPSVGHHYYYVRGNQTDAENSNFWSSPIWVNNPALALPDGWQEIDLVEHMPKNPGSTDDVIITATIDDPEDSIDVVYLWYSIDAAPYAYLEMLDDGAYPDDTTGDFIFSAVLSSMPDGTNVHYYIDSRDDAGHLVNSPSTAPALFYSFIVGPHILINEVYANAYDTYPAAGDEGSEFIELYNPTGSAINLEDWTIENQYYPDTWAWPAGASIPIDGYLVITRDSMYDAGGGGYRSETLFDQPGERDIPHWEMCDMEWGGDDVYNDEDSDNMTLVEGNTHIKLNNGYDGIVLTNDVGTLIDAMEYGRDYWIAGTPSVVAPEECSLTRDHDHTDTDDSYGDFMIIGNPTPGMGDENPSINDVQWTPYNPAESEVVTITARILDDDGTPAVTLYYAINGGGFANIAMIDTGVAPDAVAGDDIFTAQVPGQTENDVVDFYIRASFGPQIGYSPYGAPAAGNYSYVVSPHLLITEVYYNSTVNTDILHSSKFVEIYNPTSSAVDISGFILQSEPLTFSRQWAFPATTSIAAGEVIVVVNNAGDASNEGYYTEFGAFPSYIFELYDDDTNKGTDFDNPAVDNMVLVIADTYDSHFELGSEPYYDAIYLKHSGGAIIDCMEYVDDGEKVPGFPAEEATLGYSLQRDELASDTDNCLVDFTPATPTPGALPVGPTTYDIPLPAGTGWRFISFPLIVSGSAADVLNDLAGDGTTQWEAVKWYDPTDANDPWKTYRVGSNKNDMPFLDNTMGLWIYITDRGDGLLTVSGYEPVTTNIDLYTGWNLVSYPSETPVDADTSLVGTGADFISIYNGGATYLIDDIAVAPGAHTFAPGNAYWIHVGSDTVWSVDYL